MYKIQEDTCSGGVNNFLEEGGSFVGNDSSKASLEWGLAYITWCEISHSLFVNFKLITEEQTCTNWVYRSWWSEMYTHHHGCFAADKQIFVSSCLHHWPDTQGFRKKMLSSPKCCLVPLFVGRKFLPHYLLSLFSASIIAEPTLFSRRGFSFLFLFFLFLAPAACPHPQNNHMTCHQNCHFLSRAKPVCRARNKLYHKTWEKPLGCSCWGCCRMQQKTS